MDSERNTEHKGIQIKEALSQLIRYRTALHETIEAYHLHSKVEDLQLPHVTSEDWAGMNTELARLDDVIQMLAQYDQHFNGVIYPSLTRNMKE